MVSISVAWSQELEKMHTACCCVQWNATLCGLDSDGDGLTNGQELGDPDCVWTKGQAPNRTTGVTHPGMEHKRKLEHYQPVKH